MLKRYHYLLVNFHLNPERYNFQQLNSQPNVKMGLKIYGV